MAWEMSPDSGVDADALERSRAAPSREKVALVPGRKGSTGNS